MDSLSNYDGSLSELHKTLAEESHQYIYPNVYCYVLCNKFSLLWPSGNLGEMIQLARTREQGEIKSTLIKTSIKHAASQVQWSLGASFLEINATFQGSHFNYFFLPVSWTQLKGILKTAQYLSAPDLRCSTSLVTLPNMR